MGALTRNFTVFTAVRKGGNYQFWGGAVRVAYQSCAFWVSERENDNPVLGELMGLYPEFDLLLPTQSFKLYPSVEVTLTVDEGRRRLLYFKQNGDTEPARKAQQWAVLVLIDYANRNSVVAYSRLLMTVPLGATQEDIDYFKRQLDKLRQGAN